MTERSTIEKGGGTFEGLKLLLCENPLPPIDPAIEAATAEVPHSNYYTEAYSEPLRSQIAAYHGVPVPHIHVNAGSELILRQLFERFGQQVHLLTPTYPLFPEIAETYSETQLRPEDNFRFDLDDLTIPADTTLVVIVNPNNPNGGTFDMSPLSDLLERHLDTYFLVDEAFIDIAGESVVSSVPDFENLLVTRTFSKAHSLAGFRVGYAVLPGGIAADLDRSNDAYPLARPSLAAALATLEHEQHIEERIDDLRSWTTDLAEALQDLDIRTYPTETYFFLADFAPHDAGDVAADLREQSIYVKPLDIDRLGSGFMRVTTARPADNDRFVEILKKVL